MNKEKRCIKMPTGMRLNRTFTLDYLLSLVTDCALLQTKTVVLFKKRLQSIYIFSLTIQGKMSLK